MSISKRKIESNIYPIINKNGDFRETKKHWSNLNLVLENKYLQVFDIETTGLIPKNETNWQWGDWPHIVSIAWSICDSKGEILSSSYFIVKPDGYEIPKASEKIHGFSTQKANLEGKSKKDILTAFLDDHFKHQSIFVGHNIDGFDHRVLNVELMRLGLDRIFPPMIDTMYLGLYLCKLNAPFFLKTKVDYKYPTLQELYKYLFGVEFQNSHVASYDVDACIKCLFEIIKRKYTFDSILNHPQEVYNFKRKTRRTQVFLINQAKYSKSVNPDLYINAKHVSTNKNFLQNAILFFCFLLVLIFIGSFLYRVIVNISEKFGIQTLYTIGTILSAYILYKHGKFILLELFELIKLLVFIGVYVVFFIALSFYVKPFVLAIIFQLLLSLIFLLIANRFIDSQE